jgi:hypothetical protein
MDHAKLVGDIRTRRLGLTKPDPNGKIHGSLIFWWWWEAEFIPKPHWDWKKRKEARRLNLFRRCTIPSGALVHQSAFDRRDGYRSRLPKDTVAEPYREVF